jgi:predicted Zn-dependent peptidase
VGVTRLPAGLRVVTEAVPGAASVALGFYIGTGSRDEPTELAGASHFLEHLLFKGTEARGARALAEAVDAVGGDLNAYTAHEHTAFHARLPAAELALGLDVLSEVVWDPALRPADVDSERAVILEELAMEEDTPDDRVLTLLAEALFPDHPLGREVLGTRASIEAIGRDDVAAFHRRWYRPANVVVAVAGAVEHEEVVEGVRARLRGADGGEVPERTPPATGARPRAVLRRRAEQAHLALGVRGLSREDPDRYALAVANQILGGGTASRLFQSVREERGLAYSVHSWVDAHVDAGALVAYAGTAVEHLGEVLALLDAGLRDLTEGVTDDEVRVAAGYLAGSREPDGPHRRAAAHHRVRAPGRPGAGRLPGGHPRRRGPCGPARPGRRRADGRRARAGARPPRAAEGGVSEPMGERTRQAERHGHGGTIRRMVQR